MSSIGAGQSEGDKNNPILISIETPPEIEWGERREIPITQWEIDLEYTDVFEQEFVTRHTSDQTVRWGVFEKGGKGEAMTVDANVSP